MKQLFIIIILFTQALSHPHTFIEVKTTAEIKNAIIHKMHIRWKLDEMTSMMMIMELDSNADGKFEKKENDFIYENYFLSLGEYNFYMNILSNNQKLIFTPKNFKASIDNGKLIYAFDIEQPLNTKHLKIKFFDEELFVGMILEKEYITLKGVNQTQSENLKKTIFGVD